VSAVCAATEPEARDLEAFVRLSVLRHMRGLRDTPMPDVAEVRAHHYDDEDLSLLAAAAAGGPPLVGTPGALAPRLRALVEECQADELMILSLAHDHGVRKASYTLLADALG